jgi:hypothetical protein
MKKYKKTLVPLLAIFVVLSICMPVWATDYNDYTPDEIYGVWNSTYNRATETAYGSYYKCQILFTYTDVRQDAGDYWINLDYDGTSHGWPYTESLVMEYRWSNAGTWTFLAYLDIITYDGDLDITSATSSILYLRFTDYAPEDIGAANIWYFGYEPYLTAV